MFLACGPGPSVDTGEPGETGPHGGVPLEDAVTLEALLGHLQALEAAARAHGDSRAREGFTASADYAASVLQAAGYDVQRRPFTYLTWSQLGPSVLTATQGGDPLGAWTDGDDIMALRGSPPGDVTAPLHPVNLTLPPGETSTSGCDAGDFVGFPAGAVALIQRGTCTFATKAVHAAGAGASAVVVFNEGQAGRRDVEGWVLGDETGLTIPVLGASFAVGEALAAALAVGEVEARVRVDAAITEVTSENVLADTPWGDPSQTIVIGAHLDSVVAGPGINDNGSGTALVLELAVQAAKGRPMANRLRFALWGAEEVGIVGSQRYLVDLSEPERAEIMANLNYDMIGSPNGLPFVYDGDGSEGGFPGPQGSDVIEAVHAEWFQRREVAYQPTALDGRSDYLGFLLHGIPAGGLFSGAEVLKTAAEVELHGGMVASPHDPCYHRACDGLDNIDPDLFLELSRAAAYATRVLGAREQRLGGARRAWTAADLQSARAASPAAHTGCGHVFDDR